MQARPELSEILASLSLAEDLANGNPQETALRTGIIAAAIARAAGWGPAAERDACLCALLRFLGCTSFASEEAAYFFDDQAFKRAFAAADARRTLDLVQRGVELGGKTGGGRLRGAGHVLVGGRRFFSELVRSQCETSGILARALGLSEGVCRSVEQSYERFDGGGQPLGLAGAQIEAAARAAAIAYAFEIVRQKTDARNAAAEVAARAGVYFDPELTRALPDALAVVSLKASAWDQVVEKIRPLHGADTKSVARAFGDFADLKSRHTVRHSARVARLARQAAGVRGMDEVARDTLELSGLLMNIGMVSVSTTVLEKQGPLNRPERDNLTLHTFYTHKLLAAVPVFEPFAELAAAHHERADGSGYHRGLRELPLPVSLLSAADAFVALTSERAHRPARSDEEIQSILLKEAAEGKRDGQAVRLVLEAAGLRPRRDRGESDLHGLTERERTVLQLVANGLSNKRIALDLGLSPRTVQHHTIRIYEKLGVTSRAAATLVAGQRGLIE